LNAQKMEGLLCRWALSLQEYDFSIVYWKGSQNQNADALVLYSFPTASTVLQPSTFLTELKEAQKEDDHIPQLIKPLLTAQNTLKGCHWRRHPYHQIFHQLVLINGVIYCKYAPGPTSDIVTVPIIPIALRHQDIQRNHDPPSSGHLGADKTLSWLQNKAYWVGMSVDKDKYCRTWNIPPPSCCVSPSDK